MVKPCLIICLNGVVWSGGVEWRGGIGERRKVTGDR